MFQLGLMHLFGQGVEQDFEKSRGWFERAAQLVIMFLIVGFCLSNEQPR